MAVWIEVLKQRTIIRLRDDEKETPVAKQIAKTSSDAFTQSKAIGRLNCT